ncbi:hypothetical protein P389DRAFT_166660 [Cystobasidium minutum MCA 4210]|uniref:uncharacterized protein n=1 Tax=Cystobasidium minutum MCA 4210 TaxID=1397322 RepID=UPI0034CF9B3E|eukprot:jgi/Rhomi1/166660/fgenesh1_kg.2_\
MSSFSFFFSLHRFGGQLIFALAAVSMSALLVHLKMGYNISYFMNVKSNSRRQPCPCQLFLPTMTRTLLSV